MGRMTLTDAMNAGAHGHIHELLGGTWAAEWTGVANRTDEIIFPFLHSVVVSQSTVLHFDTLGALSCAFASRKQYFLPICIIYFKIIRMIETCVTTPCPVPKIQRFPLDVPVMNTEPFRVQNEPRPYLGSCSTRKTFL